MDKPSVASLVFVGSFPAIVTGAYDFEVTPAQGETPAVTEQRLNLCVFETWANKHLTGVRPGEWTAAPKAE